MPLHYVSDNSGNTVAVQIPIDEWNSITEKYAGIEELPQWQKNIIDQRLNAIADNPASLKPFEDLFKELDKED
jgi:hypothetical protein